ncbi:MAG: chitobiase/beta-hexosaminidase C-terminal domain-containing protein [Armatimonadetes bacterium]|nr:chitobiase/beta-hexosaminidase C-terminal domain-containing protein [Armatimonadota bacterium]
MFARRAFLVACFVILLALACAPSWSQTEITIGTGTSSWVYPLATYYHDARTQIIYLSSEIGGSCRITALSLEVTTVPGQTMNNFTIRMKHTTLSSYSTASWESTGWTTVYQTNQTISTTGWKQFTFTTPFDYNGTDNLMVDVSFNNSYYTTDGQCRYSTPGGTRTIYYRTDSGFGDPLTWSGGTPTPSSTTYVPNVRLTVESVTSVATPVFNPDGGTYDVAQNVVVTCATAGATIHYTTNGIDPTESDPVIASGSTVLVDHSLTLNAKAWKVSLDPSAVKSAFYGLARVIRVKPSGSDSNDGSTWDMAKRTISAALNAAVAGDEVWGAGDSAHPYNERITLKKDVGLYGGFAGTETSRDQRNWTMNVTILDGQQGGSVVTSPSGATASTVIDGFTIRNGIGTLVSTYRYGGGVYCSSSSSPTIMNNTITGNSGGGIYCDGYSSATISNNTITGNSGGGRLRSRTTRSRETAATGYISPTTPRRRSLTTRSRETAATG